MQNVDSRRRMIAGLMWTGYYRPRPWRSGSLSARCSGRLVSSRRVHRIAVRCDQSALWTYTPCHGGPISCSRRVWRQVSPATECSDRRPASGRAAWCIRFAWLDIGRRRHRALDDSCHRTEGVMHRCRVGRYRRVVAKSQCGIAASR